MLGAGLPGREQFRLSVCRSSWQGGRESRGQVPWLPALGVQRTQECESLTCQTCQAGKQDKRQLLAGQKEGLD